MKFYSTHDKNHIVSFEEALLQGLAPDSGLYYPCEFPQISQNELDQTVSLDLLHNAYFVLEKWLGDEIDAAGLREMVSKASNFPIPLIKVNDVFVLEVFHGPTLAFKDVAARYLSLLMSYFLKKRNEKRLILVATSGDTGGAIAHGFADLENIQVVVLYPKGRISRLQEEQLTRVAENIYPVEVDGYFDDCQSLVKEAFVDERLTHIPLGSANSINIGRLIPQIIYYVHAYAHLEKKDNIRFIVPSGNLGNVTAGSFAWKMGLPITLLAATNVNDTLERYLLNQLFEPNETVKTISNAMDVGNPNNFERLRELFGDDVQAMKSVLNAISISEVDTLRTISEVYDTHNYLFDPHTAVGYAACEKVGPENYTNCIIATASPLKFASEIEQAVGIAIDNREEIKKLETREKRFVAMGNSYEELSEYLKMIY